MARTLLVAALTLLAGAAVAGGLEPGAKAPDFSLQGSDGTLRTLSDFVGVLAWFPKAFTPG
jgi:peroxiredoxin Q/BCP